MASNFISFFLLKKVKKGGKEKTVLFCYRFKLSCNLSDYHTLTKLESCTTPSTRSHLESVVTSSDLNYLFRKSCFETDKN